MTSSINNGKLPAKNIYLFKLLLFICLSFILSGSTSVVKNEKGWVIVIDPGHGGKDPGAIGDISREKDITLAIALKTGEYIEKNIKDVTVLYTRKTDSFPELRDRANIANKNKADLFISIHVNWAKQKSVMGTETYVMGITKDEQNLEVAKKENEVILLENDYSTKYAGFDPKSQDSFIIFSLTQSIYHEQSTGLADKIQTQYSDRINRKDRGVKEAGFWVLFMTTMPSVLTETGFITNPAEEKFLNSKEGQEYIASAIFRACREYINEIDSKSSISFEQRDTPVKPDNSKVTPSSGSEIVFMVQIATSSTGKETKPENFKGLKDVVEIKTQERYKYATGSFPDYTSAVKFRKSIENIYPDAFVIAVKDNKTLPLQEALEQTSKK